MSIEKIVVGVVVERRRLDNPWVDHAWSAVALLPGVAAAAPGTLLSEAEGRQRYYLGSGEIGLYPSDTQHLRDNLLTGAPRVWIALRRTEAAPGLRLVGVAADPAEGESFTEVVDDIVETLAMPQAVAEQVAAFVAANHVERPFYKRKRDRAGDPGQPRRRRAGADES